MAKAVVTPKNLSIFTEPVVEIYKALEDEIFNMVARRLKTSFDLGKDNVFQWQIDKMQQLGILNKETIKELAKATDIATVEIEKAIKEVGYGAIKGIDEELKSLGNKPLPTHIDSIMESYVKQSHLSLNNFVNQTLITTMYGNGTIAKMYEAIISETTGRVLAGTVTINKAVTETIMRWSKKGVDTSFIDKGGRTWQLENYVRTTIRTTANQTYNDLRMSRMSEFDVDLVVVSSLPDPREVCSHIQGTVVTTNKTATNGYESIYDYGYGEPWGVRGKLMPRVNSVNLITQGCSNIRVQL